MVLTASPANAPRLVDALWSLMAAVRLERGCLMCSVWSEPDSTVHYLEEWDSEPDVRRRVRSDEFVALLAVIEGAERMPDIRFDFLSATRGFDYIDEIRGHSGS